MYSLIVAKNGPKMRASNPKLARGGIPHPLTLAADRKALHLESTTWKDATRQYWRVWRDSAIGSGQRLGIQGFTLTSPKPVLP